MDKAFVKVKSVTHAIKAKDVLNSNGYNAKVVRNTDNSVGESCGYSVVFDGDIMRAEGILRDYHVKFSSSGKIRNKL
ncbi:MAG: DUF3343 domain-containing protein [Ruminococcaceae bacterium]|nr:DUF3343 domain-containing protein [Oscillospiraceae bacterium]